MPRSNSSFGVAEGGNVVSAALAPGARAGGGAPPGRAPVARAGGAEVERLARPASAGRADGRVVGDRQLAAAERARRAGGVRVRVGVEGIATAAAGGRCCRLLLNDRRGGCDLRLLVSGLSLRLALSLPCGRTGLLHRRRNCSDAGLRHRWLARRTCSGRAAAELPQPLLELAVAILQLLVLAGQLPQLVFEPLDPHLEIGIIGLR